MNKFEAKCVVAFLTVVCSAPMVAAFVSLIGVVR